MQRFRKELIDFVDKLIFFLSSENVKKLVRNEFFNGLTKIIFSAFPFFYFIPSWGKYAFLPVDILFSVLIICARAVYIAEENRIDITPERRKEIAEFVVDRVLPAFVRNEVGGKFLLVKRFSLRNSLFESVRKFDTMKKYDLMFYEFFGLHGTEKSE